MEKAAARWFDYLFLFLLAKTIAFILAPVVALFADKDGWLPPELSWFQTWDNSLDGDNGWKTEHWQWRYKLSPSAARYVGRVGWLMRNAAYGFCRDVLGADVLETDILTTEGDPLTSDQPKTHSGEYRRYINRDGAVEFFQIYKVRQWSTRRCIRINVGWKLWFAETSRPVTCQFVCSISPWASTGQ